jgi:hypothetical protein
MTFFSFSFLAVDSSGGINERYAQSVLHGANANANHCCWASWYQMTAETAAAGISRVNKCRSLETNRHDSSNIIYIKKTDIKLRMTATLPFIVRNVANDETRSAHDVSIDASYDEKPQKCRFTEFTCCIDKKCFRSDVGGEYSVLT